MRRPRLIAPSRLLGGCEATTFPQLSQVSSNNRFIVDGSRLTFWRYYPQDDRPQPEPARLGELLRELHRLPAPPISLPEYA
jgi:hypothetical protein